MNEEKYSFNKLSNGLYYTFYSEGPKGRVEKVIRYSEMNSFSELTYNLAFGDWDDKRRRINDTIVTNNLDKQKVLSTVASTVLDFIRHHPKASVFAQGSTDARTRLYQMSIAAFWDEISSLFLVKAYLNGEWEDFKTGKNYSAFLIKRK